MVSTNRITRYQQ